MISDDKYNMKRLDQSKTKIQKAMAEKEPAITLRHAIPLSSVTNHHKDPKDKTKHFFVSYTCERLVLSPHSISFFNPVS